MLLPGRVSVVTSLVLAAAALSGCGHPSKEWSSTALRTSTAGICTGGDVSSEIGGQHRCLEEGQRCQARWQSDYQKYRFQCTKSDGEYKLVAKVR
jgi:hypothetical protein